MRRRIQPRDYSGLPNLLDERADQIIRDAEARAARVLHTKQLLLRAEQNFLDTGIGYVSSELADYLESHINYNAASYLRAVAKENNRPPIIAEQAPTVKHGRWMGGRVYDTIRLSIPIHNRLKPIASGLLVASQPTDSEYEAAGKTTAPITRCDSAGTWKIFFNGDEGRKAFDQFVENCHTNPVLRVVLKL